MYIESIRERERPWTTKKERKKGHAGEKWSHRKKKERSTHTNKISLSFNFLSSSRIK